ncbi:hypothetical protein VI08_07350 [Luteibacter yeojuensis]|uniref:Protein kinase domain-containing protein n=1 Tax=Luteibacter yeojuensis TaxID=345309 RepID=A0A0F3L0B0_9GAMM|nr:hypothetical protein VI08_07350 [Luteibacter yeojuensis]
MDREFFEPYARHVVVRDDFEAVVRRQLPPGWTLQRAGVWMHARPPSARLPVQGWKIHVSSVAATARIVLAIATAILVASGTAFKFAADLQLLAAINGKRWPRGGSGKFITVYPEDLRAFRRLLDDLAAALTGYAGPHVLTDRRHPDCPVVSYRYGGIAGEHHVDASGRREYLLRRPDGGMQPDDRAPRYTVPEWLTDPLGAEGAAAGDAMPLLGAGRFRPLKALAFSAAGGVYIADDLFEGRRVVIKEARPHIGAAEPATASLRKEFRLLRRLAPLDVAPRPIAHFREWEHSFLAEELLEGETLRGWLARRYPWLRAGATRMDVARYFDEVGGVFASFAATLARVHAAGVSIGDLSFHNCIVEASGRVRLIDLETAVEDGLDKVADAWTPGFAPKGAQRGTHAEAMAADRYAFGANLFAACLPANALQPLDASAIPRFLRQYVDDLGYPQAYADTVSALMHDRPERRPDPVAAMAALRDAIGRMPRDGWPTPHRVAPPAGVDGMADRLFAYIDTQARSPRKDRFVPAGPQVFETHPHGVAHGAAGILHAYLRAGRTVPANLLAWLTAGVQAGGGRGAGLMGGDAGIAWVLLEAGETSLANALLAAAPLDGAVAQHAGLHDGTAGWGLARLKAWHALGAAAALADATLAGDSLLACAVHVDGALCWPDGARQPLGLAAGASGIALFLLHLHLATDDERYLAAARAALDFDLGQGMPNAHGTLSWPAWVGGPTLLPYLRQGTAGVLAVAARMHACTGDERYRDAVLAADADLCRRHAISPGLFDGLAGLGETLLDLATFLPGDAARYRDEAMRVACGIEPFLLPRGEALAMPGAELARISCDFATGNAGAGAFLDRLAHGGHASFMLDEALHAAAQARCEAA